MRLNARISIFLVLFSSTLLWAQPNQSDPIQSRASNQSTAQSQLLRPEDGLGVLSAALETRRRFPHADCSHLVHAIYERAGLPYSYTPSRALYLGTSQFARVTKAQAGDLIVWPGHVGIVISPKEHTFYSALRSGLGVEHYNSAYWKRRGRPHFLRYVLDSTSVASAPEYSHESQSAVLPHATVRRTELTLPSSTAITASSDTVSLDVQVVESARPSVAQLQQAALHAFHLNQELLKGQSILRIARPIIFFDKFEIRKIHLKDDQGWAEVRISQQSSLAAGRADLKRRSEKYHWPLRRLDSNTWQLEPVSNAIYLSREDGTRILAHQLAGLTEHTSLGESAEDKSELAHLLDTLLQH